MYNISLPMGNSCSLKLTSLKNTNNSLVKSLCSEVYPNKPFFAQLLVFKLLFTKFLLSPSIFCSSNLSFLWGPKFYDILLCSLGISISGLGCRYMKKTCWPIYIFMCLMSPCIKFIFSFILGSYRFW